MDTNPFLMIGFMVNSTLIEPFGELIIAVFVVTWFLGVMIPPLGRLHRRLFRNPFIFFPLLTIVIADFGLERLLLSFLN